jgi:hypothetical protein
VGYFICGVNACLYYWTCKWETTNDHNSKTVTIKVPPNQPTQLNQPFNYPPRLCENIPSISTNAWDFSVACGYFLRRSVSSSFEMTNSRG